MTARRSKKSKLPPTDQETLTDLIADWATRSGLFRIPMTLSAIKKQAPNSLPQRLLQADFSQLDLAKPKPRGRGRPPKVLGDVLVERVAVAVFMQIRQELRRRRMRASIAEDEALAKVAALIGGGVKPSTIANWVRGVNKRERRKPIDERSFRRRKNQKAAKIE
ncbi:MAG TPA: hypothetical protein VNX86_15290 [Rhizomicrobium sp.]|jgi:hypothetical protein|nr:hypothetical protein [Rhizomicrobium sp.]